MGMERMNKTIRAGMTYVVALILVAGVPMTAMAEAAPADETSSTAVVTSTTSSPKRPSAPTAPTAPTAPNTGQHKPKPTTTPAPAAATQPGVGSTNTASGQQNNDATATDATKATIDNTVGSKAATGDAKVAGNTTAGSAISGDATAVATIVNNVGSSIAGPGVAQFTSDIVGDVHGDIMLYPMLLQAMIQAANAKSTATITNTTDVTNDINLNAASGNATVANNTTAGDATSGTANAVANVVNLVNSVIAASQSFIGTVNIYGNLDGDILISPDFLPQLLADNNNNTATTTSSNVSQRLNADDTQTIVNNINLGAATGNATVAGNTTAGNATTGDAATNVVILNLSGHQVQASNSMLVFVNVLGKWVGLIVDTPTGTTAAALGNGVTSSSGLNIDQSVDATTTTAITNNINVQAQSGDAKVKGNTTAGNATTGDATASAAVANVSNSSFGLSGWFGVLFINVFGSWNGSFGVDTASGNQPKGDTNVPTTGKVPPAPTGVMQFIPHTAYARLSTPMYQQYVPRSNLAISSDADQSSSPAVLAASTIYKAPANTVTTKQQAQGISLLPVAIVLVGAGLGLAIIGGRKF